MRIHTSPEVVTIIDDHRTEVPANTVAESSPSPTPSRQPPLESDALSIGSEGQLHACVSASQGERVPIQVVARDQQQCLKVGALLLVQ
jgi:hypothetical protein